MNLRPRRHGSRRETNGDYVSDASIFALSRVASGAQWKCHPSAPADTATKGDTHRKTQLEANGRRCERKCGVNSGRGRVESCATTFDHETVDMGMPLASCLVPPRQDTTRRARQIRLPQHHTAESPSGSGWCSIVQGGVPDRVSSRVSSRYLWYMFGEIEVSGQLVRRALASGVCYWGARPQVNHPPPSGIVRRRSKVLALAGQNIAIAPLFLPPSPSSLPPTPPHTSHPPPLAPLTIAHTTPTRKCTPSSCIASAPRCPQPTREFLTG
jgi:hypothetical protein